MRAAVTEGVGAMSVVDRPEPPDPGPGEVVIHPEAIGICGSDYHFFAGELSAEAGGSQFPRVLGHEVGGTIVSVGADCRPELVPGQRVAVWPLQVCGPCYPCSVGRANNCENFQLIGIHVDGGMQERLLHEPGSGCSRSTRVGCARRDGRAGVGRGAGRRTARGSRPTSTSSCSARGRSASASASRRASAAPRCW